MYRCSRKFQLKILPSILISKQPIACESALTKRIASPLDSAVSTGRDFQEGGQSSKEDNAVAAYNFYLEEYMEGYMDDFSHSLMSCNDSDFDISLDPDEDSSVYIFVNDDCRSVMSDITSASA